MGKVKDYYAALKPERTYANVMTAAAGFLFASHWQGHWMTLLYTLLGTTLVVMSACAVNNVTDRGIDAQMPRTKKRATVSGKVSANVLASLAVGFAVTGFAILLAYVNVLTALLGVIAYVDYVMLYGWSKRATPWSTLIGTISGAVPLVAGYTAVTNRFSLTALLLGLVMVFWQMVHFYAIAIFRRDDYAAANIPVWSVRYGIKDTQVWMVAFTILYLASIVGFSIAGRPGWLFTAAVVILGICWLFSGFRGLSSVDTVKWSRSMFGFSLVNLLVLSAAVTISPLLS